MIYMSKGSLNVFTLYTLDHTLDYLCCQHQNELSEIFFFFLCFFFVAVFFCTSPKKREGTKLKLLKFFKIQFERNVQL